MAEPRTRERDLQSAEVINGAREDMIGVALVVLPELTTFTRPDWAEAHLREMLAPATPLA